MTNQTNEIPVYNKTPLIREFLSTDPDSPQTYVKYETLQPGRSFKSRGIGTLIRSRVIETRRSGNKSIHVFSSSGGNAGYAAAVTCSRLSLPCTVVVPLTTKTHMVKKIRDVGAEVIVIGEHWKEADSHLTNEVIGKIDKEKTEAIYVHPFNDPTIWEGHSTIVDEIVESLNNDQVDISRVKGIVCSIGGGGLYNGIMTGLCRHNLADKIPVIAVETIGTDALSRSLKQDKMVTLDKITSIASSLGSVYVTQETFEFARKYATKSITLTDDEVLKTSLKYTDFSNYITEPACAAAIHLGFYPEITEKALGHRLDKDDIIIIIACGGSTCTYKDLETMATKS
ncbi:similar to Saccharomyces cerevisiae YCL064C CHA1 Catabolic L-serine (L-threonine) deaminase, catalyzes the degradation of both L-serine and L-threonine [Maudiozyma saulgeensis]|uniref:L-serine ammonia-lyase n=1 Tax=Maudiozyma saulgeensis TaxID=1789683 RepID=A0A1X7R3Z5_9SACH|nr:similar to Saccharomyces cerevisiae YCL064C CHA1 Catabolic L-serine (L-threonine) deaminase, catalyzes the degradation of both L-serine and L-threonine [Kazachstania saulgeensis]